MSKLREKALRAAETFVHHRGYEILDTGYRLEDGGQLDIVAKENGELVFIEVLMEVDSKKGFPEHKCDSASRARKESAAIQWLSDHPETTTGTAFRFDVISLVVIGDDRALARHFVNALGLGAAMPPFEGTCEDCKTTRTAA